MKVTINNRPTIQKKVDHSIYEYRGFIDSDGDFFIITENDVIVLLEEGFPAYNLNNKYPSIEKFLDSEFGTTLAYAYKRNDFDITINLK